jgi:hypothetical protein
MLPQQRVFIAATAGEYILRVNIFMRCCRQRHKLRRSKLLAARGGAFAVNSAYLIFNIYAVKRGYFYPLYICSRRQRHKKKSKKNIIRCTFAVDGKGTQKNTKKYVQVVGGCKE